MIEKQLHSLTPTKLRLVLIASMVVILIACGFSFWLFRGQMVTYANRISTDNATASASSDDIANLQKLQAQLAENQVAVTRAKNIVADSKFYQYQTQIVDDLERYAAQAGVSLSGFTFNNENAPKATSTPQSTPATPSTATPTTVPGLKTTSVAINIANPVKYQSVMLFLRAIELNLTKMEISGVTLTQAVGTNDLTVGPINIEVYTR